MADEPGPSDRSELIRGVLLVLGLHGVFTLLTVGVALVVAGGEDGETARLVTLWIRLLGATQAVYVVPAALTATLLQRWFLLLGVGAAAALTAVGTLLCWFAG